MLINDISAEEMKQFLTLRGKKEEEIGSLSYNRLLQLTEEEIKKGKNK